MKFDRTKVTQRATLMSLMVAASIFATACGGAATPAPTSAPAPTTAPPATTAPEVTVTTEEAITATPPMSDTATMTDTSTMTDTTGMTGTMPMTDTGMMTGTTEMSPTGTMSDSTGMSQDIVATAMAAGNFKTLTAALVAAGLDKTLMGEGPFTVFAPTDEAFAKLPAGTVDDLLKPENKDKLVKVLSYHVVPGKVMAADVVNLTTAKSVEGSDITIKVDGSTVMVNDAKVVSTDIAASNGVIHVIDTVIMPPTN